MNGGEDNLSGGRSERIAVTPTPTAWNCEIGNSRWESHSCRINPAPLTKLTAIWFWLFACAALSLCAWLGLLSWWFR